MVQMQGAECDDVRWYFERSATQQMRRTTHFSALAPMSWR
ncbi:hypothetical protein BBJK_00410 [Bifidobacterium bifidum LMG 13195]|uniref:Uncharacterized protein n=1 Tax=Bifidobacterium bifidum LMG 13195 TaxID=1207542 RepID=A0A286TAR3_BIFBI|nr:hypothetical protein BBJK_00410 [Bifidobacterium bifidum LMG 13195]